MKAIDNAVREVLGAKYDMGLFHDPYLRIGEAKDDPPDLNADSRLHRPAAREVARKSMVLLENRNRTLPLAKLGRPSRWSARWPTRRSTCSAAGRRRAIRRTRSRLRTGMNAAVAKHGKGRVIYARGANITNDEGIVKYLNFLNWDTPEVTQDKRTPAAMIEEAVAAAQPGRCDRRRRRRGARHVARVVEPHQPGPAAEPARPHHRAQGHRQAAGAGADERPPAGTACASSRRPTRSSRPGTPAPRAATRSPRCSTATTTRRASCRSRSRVRSARSRPTTTIRGWAAPSPKASRATTPRSTSRRSPGRCIPSAMA